MKCWRLKIIRVCIRLLYYNIFMYLAYTNLVYSNACEFRRNNVMNFRGEKTMYIIWRWVMVGRGWRDDKFIYVRSGVSVVKTEGKNWKTRGFTKTNYSGVVLISLVREWHTGAFIIFTGHFFFLNKEDDFFFLTKVYLRESRTYL